MRGSHRWCSVLRSRHWTRAAPAPPRSRLQDLHLCALWPSPTQPGPASCHRAAARPASSRSRMKRYHSLYLIRLQLVPSPLVSRQLLAGHSHHAIFHEILRDGCARRPDERVALNRLSEGQHSVKPVCWEVEHIAWRQVHIQGRCVEKSLNVISAGRRVILRTCQRLPA